MNVNESREGKRSNLVFKTSTNEEISIKMTYQYEMDGINSRINETIKRK